MHPSNAIQLSFESGGPERKSVFEVTLYPQDLAVLLKKAAEYIPELTATFGECAAMATNAYLKRLTQMAEEFKSIPGAPEEAFRYKTANTELQKLVFRSHLDQPAK